MNLNLAKIKSFPSICPLTSFPHLVFYFFFPSFILFSLLFFFPCFALFFLNFLSCYLFFVSPFLFLISSICVLLFLTLSLLFSFLPPLRWARPSIAWKCEWVSRCSFPKIDRGQYEIFSNASAEVRTLFWKKSCTVLWP